MIKFHLKHSVLVSCILLLSSCGSSNNNSTNNSSTNKLQNSDNNQQQVLGNVEISAKFNRKVDLDNSNDFQNFKMNANLHKITINILNDQRIDNGSIQCFDITNKTAAPKIVSKSNLIDGRYAEIEIDLKNKEEFENKYSCTVFKDSQQIGNTIEHTFYRDLVVDSDINFNSKGLGLNLGENKIGALIITTHGNLVTMGNDVKIIATDVVFENGGTIETFRKNDLETADNQNGLSGGKIEIETDNAFGPLKVNLRGRNGGRQTQTQSQQAPTITTPNTIFLNTSECPGLKGPKGLKGITGFSGLNGGDSGTLIIDVKNKQHLFETISKDSINFYPGTGSIGGIGGDGGRGGLGNIYKLTYDSGLECSAPKCHPPLAHKTCDASYGPQGDQGEIGLRGLDGNKQKVIINN